MGHSPQLLRSRSELRASRALRPAAIHAEKARLLVGDFRAGCRSVYWQMIMIYLGTFGIYLGYIYTFRVGGLSVCWDMEASVN